MIYRGTWKITPSTTKEMILNNISASASGQYEESYRSFLHENRRADRSLTETRKTLIRLPGFAKYNNNKKKDFFFPHAADVLSGALRFARLPFAAYQNVHDKCHDERPEASGHNDETT